MTDLTVDKIKHKIQINNKKNKKGINCTHFSYFSHLIWVWQIVSLELYSALFMKTL